MPCILWRGSGAQHDVFCIIGACCANFRGPQATSIKMDLFLFCSCKTLSETYQTFSDSIHQKSPTNTYFENCAKAKKPHQDTTSNDQNMSEKEHIQAPQEDDDKINRTLRENLPDNINEVDLGAKEQKGKLSPLSFPTLPLFPLHHPHLSSLHHPHLSSLPHPYSTFFLRQSQSR
jgi:hypothetical protein